MSKLQKLESWPFFWKWNKNFTLQKRRTKNETVKLFSSMDALAPTCPHWWHQYVLSPFTKNGNKKDENHKTFFFFLLVMIKTSFFFTYSHLFPSKKRLNTPGGAFNLSCGITVRKKTWRSSIGMDLTLTAKANIPTNAAFALQVTIWIWADGDNGFDADHRCFK